MSDKTRLLIARHGNTFASTEVVRRVGITDLPLAESGLQQALRLGAYLKEHALIPDVIFTSTLKRTQQTAEQAQKIMQTELPIQPLSMFDEIDYGPDENQPETAVIARLGQEALNAWEAHAIVPAGWNVDPKTIIRHWHHFSDQLTRNYPQKTILVVTSNGIARFAPYLTGDFLAFTNDYSIKIATGAVCQFEKTPSCNGWTCLQWNVRP